MSLRAGDIGVSGWRIMNITRGGSFEGQHPDAMLFGAGLVEALINKFRGRYWPPTFLASLLYS